MSNTQANSLINNAIAGRPLSAYPGAAWRLALAVVRYGQRRPMVYVFYPLGETFGLTAAQTHGCWPGQCG